MEALAELGNCQRTSSVQQYSIRPVHMVRGPFYQSTTVLYMHLQPLFAQYKYYIVNDIYRRVRYGEQ